MRKAVYATILLTASNDNSIDTSCPKRRMPILTVVFPTLQTSPAIPAKGPLTTVTASPGRSSGSLLNSDNLFDSDESFHSIGPFSFAADASTFPN